MAKKHEPSCDRCYWGVEPAAEHDNAECYNPNLPRVCHPEAAECPHYIDCLELES